MKISSKILFLLFMLLAHFNSNAQWPNFKLDASAGVGKFFIDQYIQDLYGPGDIKRVKDICTGGTQDIGFSFFSNKGFGLAFNYTHYLGKGKGPNYEDKFTINSLTIGPCYLRSINESVNYVFLSVGLRKGFATIEVTENGKTESVSAEGWKFNYKFSTCLKILKKLYFNINLEGATASIFFTGGLSLIF